MTTTAPRAESSSQITRSGTSMPLKLKMNPLVMWKRAPQPPGSSTSLAMVVPANLSMISSTQPKSSSHKSSSSALPR